MHTEASKETEMRGGSPAKGTRDERARNKMLDRFQEELVARTSAGQRVVINLDPAEAWAILAMLPLALQHPGISGYAETVARDVIGLIAAEICPPGSAAEQIYRMGERGL